MIDFLLLLLLMVGATWFLGWWGILLVAAGWGWWWRMQKPAWRPALAAALAWGLWLALAGPAPALLKLADRLGRLMSAPGIAVTLAPIGYAALLGWAAARLMQGIRGSHPN